MTPRDREALLRIVECIDTVVTYTERGGEAWAEDGMAVDAIAKRIEEIGEVAKRIDVATLVQMPGIDWKGLKGIREILVHDHDEVDVTILVAVVNDDLPVVRTIATTFLAKDM